MTYLEQCNKYFIPLDEIAEAIHNQENVAGLSFDELKRVIKFNKELKSDLEKYEGVTL